MMNESSKHNSKLFSLIFSPTCLYKASVIGISLVYVFIGPEGSHELKRQLGVAKAIFEFVFHH